MINSEVIFVLDYDGVLVDSYYKVSEIYKYLKNRYNLGDGYIESAIMLEDLIDFSDNNKYWFDIYDKYLKEVFNIDEETYRKLMDAYWRLRSNYQKLFEDAIPFLNKHGKNVIIVSGNDENKNIKLRRMEEKGILELVEKVYIHGYPDGDFDNIVEAIAYIVEENKDKKIFYVDDKMIRLKKIRDNVKAKNLMLFKREYKPKVYPYSLSWVYPKVEVIKINSLFDLEKYL